MVLLVLILFKLCFFLHAGIRFLFWGFCFYSVIRMNYLLDDFNADVLDAPLEQHLRHWNRHITWYRD